jgi:hypothetical protein
MAFANRRLKTIAQRRLACGTYGANNLDHRMMIKGFEPTPKVLRTIFQGVRRWLRAEWKNLFLRTPTDVAKNPVPATVI